MRSLQDISNAFHAERREREAYNNAMRQKLDQLEQAAKRYQRLAAKKMGEHNKLSRDWDSEPGVYWTDRLLRPLLEEIEERTGWTFANKNDLHTFGLRCECPVHIDSEEEDEFGKKWLAYLTFTPRFGEDGCSLYIDTGRTKGKCYPAGTIGDMNGFNNETAHVESVEQIIELLQKQMAA